MKTEIARRRRTFTADIFNPTKVCELRLAGAQGRPRVSKKDYVLSNGSYSLSLACFTHPVFLFRPFLPLSREHSLKSPLPSAAGAKRPNTRMKMGQLENGGEEEGGGGGWKADEGIGERNFLPPTARDLLPGPTPSLFHPAGFLTFSRSLTSSPPTPSTSYKAAAASCMLRLTFYTTAGVGSIENNYAVALSATSPRMEHPPREGENDIPWIGSDRVTE